MARLPGSLRRANRVASRGRCEDYGRDRGDQRDPDRVAQRAGERPQLEDVGVVGQRPGAMKLPSVADAEVFSDRNRIQRTGTSEMTTTTKIATDHPLY